MSNKNTTDVDASPDEAESLAHLRVILGDKVLTSRLKEILAASSGSVERAVEIYFHQQEQQQTKSQPLHVTTAKSTPSRSQKSEPTLSNNSKKRSPQKLLSSQASKTSSPCTKQARLDSFFDVGKASISSPQPKQTRLDSFFGKLASSSPPPSRTKTSNRSSAENTTSSNVKSDNGNGIDMTAPVKNIPPSTKRPVNSSTQDAPLATAKQEAEHKDQVSFERFADLLQQISDTPKRNIKLNALESFISEIVDQGLGLATRAESLTSTLYLILGGRTSKPLNVSGSAVSKALQLSLGVSRTQLSKAYRQYGDLGDCAANFFQKKSFFVTSSRHLSVVQVSEGMEKISVTDGRDAKQHVLLGLLRGCQSKIEMRFLVRLLVGNMRIGANLKTVLAALAMAVVSRAGEDVNEDLGRGKPSTMDVKDAIALVQKTHDICPSIEKIVFALLKGGFEQMQNDCIIQVHTPISPMLAHPINAMEGLEKALNTESCTGAIMEYKYDGVRLQAHYDGVSKTVKLFSRHMLETTSQFPEVASYLLEAFRTKEASKASFIIDAEIVGVEGSGGDMRLLPFQDLSTRRKKNDDGTGIRVKVFAFDLMFLDGTSLISEPLNRRRTLLFECFRETFNFAHVTSRELKSFDESAVTGFLKASVEDGAEGLMVKLCGSNSSYEAGTRSQSWLKVKRDYVAGFSDTIDVVPIGAWYGNGRKAQKSFLSPVLLAVYDDQEDVYRSISRCMSFTDEMYTNMREFYFCNTPYPEDVKDKHASLNVIKEDDGTQDDNDDQSDDDNSDADDGVMLDSRDSDIDSDVDGEDRKNCFPSRPSSTAVITNEIPSIWFKPMEVFEVSFADLSLSRQHTAAAGLVDDTGRGVALRFPRFKRRRPDKKPEQATTSIQIAQLFSNQAKINRSGRPN